MRNKQVPGARKLPTASRVKRDKVYVVVNKGYLPLQTEGNFHHCIATWVQVFTTEEEANRYLKKAKQLVGWVEECEVDNAFVYTNGKMFLFGKNAE